MHTTVCYFDYETGGTEPHHPNIQIAAVAVRGGREVASFERKIQFDVDACQPEALEMNSYEPLAWQRESIPEKAATAAFVGFLRAHADTTLTSKRGRPYQVTLLGGHNIVRFDIPRLQAATGGAFIPACWWYPLDTLQRAIWYFNETNVRPPANYQLSTLAEYFGIPTEGAHDALADVRMCAALADQMASAMRKAA